MYVVTGASGFIGSCVVAGLNERGIDDILVVDRLESDDKYKNLIGLTMDDYMDKEDFIVALEAGSFDGKIKGIIHMGACSATTELDATFLMGNNYKYTQRLALWCLQHHVRYIYASSAATYGDGSKGYSDECDLKELEPLNPYGFSKSLFDLWAERKGVLSKMVGLKFFNVYGPREDHKADMRSVIHKSYGQIKAVGEVKLFKSHRPDYKDGEQLRDFVYVKDVVKVILFFLDHPEQNGIFNVGTGEARSFKDLVTATFQAMGHQPNIQYIDMPEDLQPRYQYYTQAEMGKLRAAGYTEAFSSLEDGIKDYVQTYLDKR
ncbi:MAG: ADP-glyceromanno-heptose 6-epimerase [SAR324 cluster bacterium]|uniref:ADP-L-glycero-D-manno-heptose-6-epimerase n=1 Tax=SAR324 cluster bacterium TaxID=2024889 RepID=A0A2A4T3J1_9DELT|nr:MAG: ADP-glyceromanno-heptose 6-epimerase [SAR324 cluster bacterium]